MIVLVNPKTETKYPQIPLGLLSLASVWQKRDTVKIIDRNVSDDLLPDADVFGVTVMSCAYESAKKIVQEIRASHQKSKIILGGAHVSALPNQVKEETGCDAVVIGEGESYDFQDGITQGMQVDLDSIPLLPYELVNMTKYRSHVPHGRWQPFVPMVTSRGCPYSCKFCSKSVFGNHYRVASADKIFSEMAYLKKRGIKEVAFYDDTFTLNRKHVLDLCSKIAPLKLKWSCETRVNVVDLELLEAMKEAGCFSISYGIESGNQKTLDYINKGITLAQIHEAVSWTKKARIGVTGYFMFVPDVENHADMVRTVKLAKELSFDYVQFTVMSPIVGSTFGGDGVSYSGITGGGQNVGWAYKDYYFNLRFIMKQFGKMLTSYSEFKLAINGVRMFKNELLG